MDEPTASLSAKETAILLRIVSHLRDEGVSVLYVSHRLEEVFEIADCVTVLRDGRHVATDDVKSLNKEALIRLMVGRTVELSEAVRRPATLVSQDAKEVSGDEPDLTLPPAGSRGDERGGGDPKMPAKVGEVVLDVQNLSRAGAFEGVSFHVRAGEIVGLAGLVGAGRSEVVRAIFGVDSYDAGKVTVSGRDYPKGSVSAAMQMGVGLVPEDRQHLGLVLPMSVGENLSLALLRQLTRFGLVDRRKESALIQRQIRELHVHANDARLPAETLSGGNQQKVVLGKWLARAPRVLILDEPTRGIDVGAKVQVHRLIHQLADDGVATIVISSDLPELLTVCDRLLVLREGRLVGELNAREATQEEILELALPDAERTEEAARP